MTCQITGVKKDAKGIIEIPELSPNGHLVVAIANNAFKGNLKISGIVFPESVQKIGHAAFENCKNLTQVTFPKELNSIGNKAFKRCDLKEIVLPKVSSIDFAAFSYNSDAVIIIDQEINYVKSHAFNGCKKILCSIDNEVMEKWDPEWDAGLGAIDSKKPQKDIDFDIDDNKPLAPHEAKNNVENLRTVANAEVENADGIYYTKTKKLSFPVKKLSFKNIPVLKRVQLSFYEKYTILLLQKGILAANKDELVIKISNFLNVSNRCILEFIDYLMETNSIVFDESKKLFKLDEAIHYSLNEALNNAMFAEFDVKLADCDKIILIEDAMSFLLDEDFPNEIFKTKGTLKETTEVLPYSLQMEILNKRSVLRALFERHFENTNMHLTKHFTFDLRNDKYSEYTLEFDAILEYIYDIQENKSIRKNIIVQKENLLPDEYIDSLASQFDIDDDLPKFIKHRDFYENIIPSSDAVASIDEEIEVNKNSAVPLEVEINTEKANLISIKKQHVKKKKIEEELANEIRIKIKQAEKDISMNESIAADVKGENSDLVKNLKNTIKELMETKKTLSDQLQNQEKAIAQMTEKFSSTENALNESIKIKEEEIKNINKKITEYESERKTLVKEQKSVVSQNEKMLNPVIKSVVEKYPAGENVMNRFISDICLWLDSALSASECDSYDEICRSIDFIRESYRKLLQAVFNVCLKTKADTLGIYLSDPFHIIEIDDMLRKRNTALDIKNQLIKFHSLANAIGHSTENGPKKHENIRRVEGFKELTVKEREKMLLAIPNLFNSIKFTKTEIKEISALLKI